MIYFTLLPLYPVLCLFALRQVRHQHDARLLTTRHQALISATLVICSLLVMVPFVIEVLAHYQFRHGGGLAVDETVWALWFLLLTGVLSVAVLGRGLWSMGKHGTGSFFAIGAHVLGFLIGVYFLFCTFSHLAFYKLSEGDAGFLNWPLVRDIAPVSDVKCDHDFLLVRNMNAEEVSYRCPARSAWIFGRYTNTPLVLWPDYTDGTSAELGLALRTLHRKAKVME
jgi:hypothetical protein